jgi:hypothetical protein
MSTGRIIWLVALISNLILFFFIIPVDIYDHHDMMFSFTGGIISGACLFMFLGDFSSTYELFEKVEPGTPEPTGKKLAPFAVIPGIILIIVLLFYHLDEKDSELSTYPILTKGSVFGGESTTTRRNFSSNTSYSVNIIYKDSLNHEHRFEQSVDGSEFRNLYQGAVVDVVYSKKHPALAKALMDIEDLSKVKKIPQGKISISHLMSILDGEVKEDSILEYLNSINYEWTKESEKGYYKNDKMKLAIKIFPEDREIAFLQTRNLLVVEGEDSFEKNITKEGFKKKANNVNGVEERYYYNDHYVVSKETKTPEYRAGQGISMEGFEIFHITRVD